MLTFVQTTESLCFGDFVQGRVCPFSGSLQLHSGLDNVDCVYVSAVRTDSCCTLKLTWGVQGGTDESTDSTSDQVVSQLSLLGLKRN